MLKINDTINKFYLFIIFVLLGITPVSSSECRDITKLIVGEYIVDVAYSNGEYYMLSNHGHLLSTESGESWRVEAISDVRVSNFKGIASINNELIAINSFGRIYQRLNGIWTLIYKDGSIRLNKIISNNSKYIIVGAQRGKLHVIEFETLNVNQVTSHTFNEINAGPLPITPSVVNNGFYISLGEKMLRQEQASSEWVMDDKFPIGLGIFAQHREMMALVTVSGNISIKKSHIDQWEIISNISAGSVHDFIWSGKNYVIAGSCGTLSYSDDGISWGNVAIKETTTMKALGSGGNYLFAVGEDSLPDEDGISAVVLVSTNGKTWKDISLLVRGVLEDFRSTTGRNENRRGSEGVN